MTSIVIAQHDAYHSLRGTRTNMEELSLHLNKTLRDFIEEGHEKVGLLRTEDVAPALKIVTDYRYVILIQYAKHDKFKCELSGVIKQNFITIASY